MTKPLVDTSAKGKIARKHGILIVEDDLILAKDCQCTLMECGYDAYAIARSSEVAMTRVEERRPDLVLMDVKLRGVVDGIDTASRIKAKCSTAIVYLTAHADAGTLARAKATEPHGYLVKPVNPTALCTTVEVSLHKHEREKEREENRESEKQSRGALSDVERDARESNEAFRTMVEAVKEYAIVILDVHGRIASWNVGAERISGYAENEILGRHYSYLFSIIDIKAREPERQLKAALVSGKAESQGWRVRKDGTKYFAEVIITAVRDASGKPRGFSTVTQDITARKSNETMMTHQATHDALTNLPNRSLLTDRLDQAIAAAHRHKSALALFYLDLDGFKGINDNCGHAIGDQLLQSVATRLTDCVRASDTVCRMGGDEFVILLVDVAGHREAAVCAEKVLRALRKPHVIDERELIVSATIGISLCPEDGIEAGVLLSQSDSTMYEAKRAGKDTFQFYEKEVARLGPRV